MSEGVMRAVGDDEPVMVAWKAFKDTDEYRNARTWAERYIPEDDPEEIERIKQSGANPWTRWHKIQAVEGSLWTLFCAGWKAAGKEI